MSGQQARRLVFDLRRDSPFSFECLACGRCCQGKVILVGPHEILGMARVLGAGTTEFLSRYTEGGGTTLRTTDDSRCVFVGPEGGCRVHPRRPLVCRLYPLGRQTGGDDGEAFALYGAHPGCQAVIGRDGTVASFLESQGVEPYVDWSRRYSELYIRMIEILGRAEPEPESAAAGPRVDKEQNRTPLTAKAPRAPSNTGRSARKKAGTQQSAERTGLPPDGSETWPAPTAQLSPWLDIDSSLAEYCAARGLAPPADIDAAIDLHIRAMEEWLEALETGPSVSA